MMTTSTEPVVLKVGGMTCAACADTVRQAIRRACPKATADHFDIVVNLLSNEVCVSVPEHVLIDPYVLKQAIENAGFECRLPPANDQQSDDEEDVEIRGELQTWRRRLMVCALLGIPEIVVCMILMPLLPELHQQLACLEFFVVTALQWSVGLRYAQKAFNNLRLGVLTMDLLVSLASFTCYLSTVLTALQWNYFESASTLLLFVTFGKYLECLARKRTRQHLRRLGKSLRRITEAAQILADGTVIVVKVDDLRVRDAVQVKPGEYVPTDGLVLRGSTTCEEALLTGEPKPVFKDAGSVVFAGTLNNGSGVLTVEVTQPASQSTLAHVLRAVQATSQKARLQRLADRVARLFIPAVLMLSILTFIVWALLIWIGLAKEVTIGDAVGFAVAVLTVACPCALGLAVPTALLVGKGVAARHGLLIKDDEALLAVARCDRPTIIFDKTGTLTKGTLKVCQFVLLEHAPTNKNNATSRQILRDVYWLERHCSEHVIAASLCD
jgi:cation transport ATPase